MGKGMVKEMNTFFTFGMLKNYATVVASVFATTQFIKGLPIIKKIPTKYISFIIAMIIVVITNIASNTFKLIDLLPYFLTSIIISMNANGIYDFDNKYKEIKEKLGKETGVINEEENETITIERN